MESLSPFQVGARDDQLTHELSYQTTEDSKSKPKPSVM